MVQSSKDGGYVIVVLPDPMEVVKVRSGCLKSIKKALSIGTELSEGRILMKADQSNKRTMEDI